MDFKRGVKIEGRKGGVQKRKERVNYETELSDRRVKKEWVRPG